MINAINREITAKLAQFQDILTKTRNLECPTAVFDFPKELTIERTLKIHKWILMSYYFLYHEEIAKMIKANPTTSEINDKVMSFNQERSRIM